MANNTLFDPINIGKITLKNRIVMAPMTRSRASSDHIPNDLMVEYYRQRATNGLIITEGTSPHPNGDGYARTPGIYSSEQMSAWKKITAAVHEKDGKIFIQLMHVGRIAHPLNKSPDAQTVAPSAIQANTKMFTDQQGMQDMAIPRALHTEEIPDVIAQYQQATKNAFECGFDGVELHAATGYLPAQFLSSNTNLRTDQYGGSIDNRLRFVIETLTAMSRVNGSDKIGIRIWPGGEMNDIHDANPLETYTALIKALNPLNLAYLHTIKSSLAHIDAFKMSREHYQGYCMLNGGFTYDTAEEAIESGLADMISFGTLALANPDLVERFQKHAQFNQIHPATFYSPGPHGYIDYSFLHTEDNL
jgi:2,4-dienoyl-CoA reductase-like NADH-dependent reductase (Old Yellow Enzyme family)